MTIRYVAGARVTRFLTGFFILLLLAGGASAQGTGPAIGTIKVSSGDASVQRGGTMTTASEGLDVQHQDILLTGSNGALGVTLNDGTLISLGPNSRFEFAEFEFAPQRNSFSFFGKILEGTMVYQSGRIGHIAPEKTRIETPLSVIAVRGTRFAVRVPAGAGN
ncbi:FecR family protein [Nisaea sp.]|uniref:FecR family protein n=1 Tax=Nisaea sp. TaxID=2024842 RepID=UPI002B275EE5|nr:FecR domain-containing protein [Nisaea sp.]